MSLWKALPFFNNYVLFNFCRDTTDAATIAHFKSSVAAANIPGYSASWTPNRAVVITLLGVDTDATGGTLVSG